MPTVMVVGASRGIGFEFVRQYAAAGWSVHGTVREAAHADALIGLGARAHTLDVRDEAALDRLGEALRDEAIDVLVHNAGVRGPRDSAFGNLDAKVWSNVFAVNAIAPIKLAERFVEHVARSRGRVMAFVSSWRGSIGENEDGGLYLLRSSKAALNASVKSLSIDLAPRSVIAVALHPGWVRTEMGGEDAPLAVEAGVAGLRHVIETLTPASSGRFIAHDGRDIAW
jgi:NAD(P)-dependent dehydrogenase (short-subunit alcohol dehydrogenase family)